MTKISSVLIADDHDLVREAVAHVITTELDIPVTTAKDKAGAMKAIAEHGPFTIVLLDIAMPGMNGVKCVEEVIEANSPGAVVVFSGVTDQSFALNAIVSGARGFVPKTTPLRALVTTLELIASGQVFVPFNPNEDKHADTNSRRLSDNELRVLKLLVKGQSNKEIARDLDLTEVRVKMHLRGLCAKLGAKNRTQAAIIADQTGIVH